MAPLPLAPRLILFEVIKLLLEVLFLLALVLF